MRAHVPREMVNPGEDITTSRAGELLRGPAFGPGASRRGLLRRLQVRLKPDRRLLLLLAVVLLVHCSNSQIIQSINWRCAKCVVDEGREQPKDRWGRDRTRLCASSASPVPATS